MLSRRDKLLVQPWEDRRYKDHRAKVKSALPAIDDRPPAARPHVAVKLKKFQREADRKHKISQDNFSLLQRLAAIMRAGRLDNRWSAPPPDLCSQKVGMFFDAASLRRRLSARDRSPRRLSADSTYSNVKCYACELSKRKYEFKTPGSGSSRHGSLPSIL